MGSLAGENPALAQDGDSEAALALPRHATGGEAQAGGRGRFGGWCEAGCFGGKRKSFVENGTHGCEQSETNVRAMEKMQGHTSQPIFFLYEVPVQHGLVVSAQQHGRVCVCVKDGHRRTVDTEGKAAPAPPGRQTSNLISMWTQLRALPRGAHMSLARAAEEFAFAAMASKDTAWRCQALQSVVRELERQHVALATRLSRERRSCPHTLAARNHVVAIKRLVRAAMCASVPTIQPIEADSASSKEVETRESSAFENCPCSPMSSHSCIQGDLQDSLQLLLGELHQFKYVAGARIAADHVRRASVAGAREPRETRGGGGTSASASIPARSNTHPKYDLAAFECLKQFEYVATFTSTSSSSSSETSKTAPTAADDAGARQPRLPSIAAVDVASARGGGGSEGGTRGGDKREGMIAAVEIGNSVTQKRDARPRVSHDHAAATRHRARGRAVLRRVRVGTGTGVERAAGEKEESDTVRCKLSCFFVATRSRGVMNGVDAGKGGVGRGVRVGALETKRRQHDTQNVDAEKGGGCVLTSASLLRVGAKRGREIQKQKMSSPSANSHQQDPYAIPSTSSSSESVSSATVTKPARGLRSCFFV